MIEVVNQRNFRGEGVYIGRRMKDIPGSPLRNDFRIGPDGSRDEVVTRYRAWLRREIKRGKGPALDELRRLVGIAQAGQDLRLVCWCAPSACHGDVLKAAIIWMLKQPCSKNRDHR